MALFKRNKPDLPNPPAKFSEISKPDFEEEFPSYTPSVDFDEDKFEERKISMPIPEFPRMEEEHRYEKKPLFIKVDKYEDDIAILNSIKQRLEDASSIINELRQIRRNEDVQLDEWSENVRSIKEKLLNIDSMLFE